MVTLIEIREVEFFLLVTLRNVLLWTSYNVLAVYNRGLHGRKIFTLIGVAEDTIRNILW